MRRLSGGVGRLLCAAVACAATLAFATPEVDRAVAWLQSQPQANGSLAGEASSIATPLQSRAEAIVALKQLATAPAIVADLVAAEADSATEYSARKAIALAPLGRDVSASLAAMLSAQNADGGFGPAPGYASDALDTAYALLALKAAGSSDASAISNALGYLSSAQAIDGSFGINEQPSIFITAHALLALDAFAQSYVLTTPIQSAKTYLANAQTSGAYSSVLDNATAALALAGATTDTTVFSGAQSALKGAQLADGSWADDPYLTALAARALAATGSAPPPPTAGQLNGNVLDASSGAPLAGATIQLSGPQTVSASSDASGAFVIPNLAPGAYTVTVTLNGYTTTAVSATITAGIVSSIGAVRLAVSATAALLEGTIRDGAAGQPLVGATVAFGAAASTTTDAAGHYVLAGLTPGPGTVSVTAAGYDPISVSATLVAGASTLFSPSLYATGQTPASASLKGHVVDRATGQPVAAATVAVGSSTATTNATGDFAISALAVGSATLQVSASGYSSASLQTALANGTNDAGTIALDKHSVSSATLSGTISDSASGTAIGGATIAVQSSALSATSDATGHYQIAGITSLQFSVSVSAPGYASKTENVTLTQLADSTLNVALDKTQSGSFSVTSTTTDQATYGPYSNIEVTTNVQNGAATDQSLTFSATVLDPNSVPVLFTPAQPFALPANATTSVAIDIHNTNQPAATYAVHVQGVDANGVVQVEGSASFAIAAAARISGGVVLDPPVAQAGASLPISISASIANHGNLPIPAGAAELTITLDSSDPNYAPLGQTTVGTPILSNGFLNFPAGAVYDAQGTLWIVNRIGGKIVRATPQADGTYVSEVWFDPSTLSPNPFPGPVGLAMDDVGDLYVLNSSTTIYKVDPGKNVTQITTNLGLQTGISWHGGLLYVATAQNTNVIYSVNPATQLVTPLIGQGFSRPAGIAVAADGTAYVSNSGNNSIVKVSTAGEVTPFLTSGLTSPQDLMLNGTDLLVADSGSNRILKISTLSQPTLPLAVYSSGPNLSSPTSLALGPDGTLYVGNTGFGASSIATVAPGGGAAQTFAKSLVPDPVGMTYDSTGNLFIVGNAGSIVKVGTTGAATFLTPTFSGAQGITALDSGSLVICYSSGAVIPYPSTGSDAVTGLLGPSGIASAGGTKAYVSERSGNRVSLVDLQTKQSQVVAASFVNSGDDVYFAPNGDRYILNSNRIDHVSGTSGATMATTGATFTAGSFAPSPAGGFYLQEAASIKVMSASSVVTALVTTPALPASLSVGTVIDNSSNILVGDRNGRKVLEVNPATGQLSIFADLSTFSTSQLLTITSDGSGGVFAGISDGKLIHVPSTGANPSLVTALPLTPWRLAYDSTGNTLYVKTSNDVRAVNVASPSQVTILPLPGGSGGALQFANGLIHLVSGTSELRSYTPQGVLSATLAGFSHPAAVAWDGTRIIVADDFKTISIVPGQLPQTLADATVGHLAISGGLVYGTQSTAVLQLPNGSRTYAQYFTQPGLSVLGPIAARGDGGFSFASAPSGDQRVMTIDGATPPNVIASYAGIGGPTGIALDPAGNVYVASSSFRQVVKIDPVTRQSVVYDTFFSGGALGFYNGQLVAANGGTLFTYSPNGARSVLFNADPNASYSSMAVANGKVYLTDSNQLKVSSWNGTSMAPFASGLVSLEAIAVGPDGAIYAGSFFGSVVRVAGTSIRQLAGDLGSVSAVGVDSSGRVYAGSTAGYITEYDAATFARHDITNLAQITGAASSLSIQYLAPDATNVVAAGVGSNPTQAYRLTYTPPAPPPPPGTVVYRAQVSLPDLPVGADPLPAAFGTWPAANPGDFTFSVHRLDSVTGEAVNQLHVGPSASGTINVGSTVVPPGNSTVHVSAHVSGGDFASVARVDPSKTVLAINDPSRALVMGADASGRIYFTTTNQVLRTTASGGTEVVWNSQTAISGIGKLPFDSKQNFYYLTGAQSTELYGISSITKRQVSHDTFPEPILGIVVDSQDVVWALSTANGGNGFTVGHVYRLIPGQPATMLPTPTIESPYALAIDGKDNLYVQTSFFAQRTDSIIRVARDGTTSLVIGPDSTGDPLFEYEGSSATGDCADSIFVTPIRWKKYGQGTGWAFPQFEEEHQLIQVNGTTGKVAQIFDGAQFSTDLTDMDGVVYDRFGGQLIVFSERWITRGANVLYRMPVTCGTISTDLHVIVPPGQSASGYSVPPTSVSTASDGSSEIVWSLKDLQASGQSLAFDTALPSVGLGETRPVASQAFLLFNDSFTGSQAKVPLAVPAVTGDGLLDVGVNVSPSSYPANTPISGTVTIGSRDPTQARTANLVMTVTDAQGVLVAQLPPQTVTVPASGSLSVPVNFNTGNFFSGSYLVKAQLIDPASGIPISNASGSFDILADFFLAIASISSDKSNYQPIDTANLDARAKNVSTNEILTGATLTVVVHDPSGAQTFSASRNVSELVPGALQDVVFPLLLNAAPSGMYSAQVTLADASGAVLDSRTTTFNVLSTVDTGSGLQGSLAVPPLANTGTPLNITATLVDKGNAALSNVPVTFRVINPSNGTAIFQQSQTASVAIATQQQVIQSWDTTGVAAGTYVATASVTFGSQEILLGQANVTIGAIQPFSFAPRVDVQVSTAAAPDVVESTAFAVGGIVAPAPISVDIGEYRINAGGWTAAAGFVNPGDSVTVRVTASTSFNTTTTATLTIAGFSAPFSVTTVNPDITPDPFSFTAIANAPLATLETSNVVTIAGIDIPVPISIAGGAYSINGGPFTTAAGTVANGDQVAVQLTTANALGTASSATLTVSNVSATFTVTTTAIDDVPDAFSFTAQTDVPVSTLQTSNQVTIAGINVAVPISIVGGQYSVNGGAYTSAAGTVSSGDKVTVQHTSSASFSTTVTTTLTVSSFSTTFESATEGEDKSPDAFSFTPQVDVALGDVRESNKIVVTGINTTVPISIVGGEYSVNAGAYTSAAGTVTSGNTVTVRETSASTFATSTTATLTVSDFPAPFTVTTKTKADLTTTPAFAGDERVLVLVSCKQGGEDDADDDSSCVSQRVPFVDSYLASLGVLHRIVTTTLDFKAEMRSGRYDAYWVSGGAKKLMDDLADELRAAAFRGETVILDGVHDQRNGDLDRVVGIDYRGKPSGAKSVTLTGAMLPSGTFSVAGTRPIRVRLTTGLRQGVFNTGDPAIATNTYGYGSGLLFAFDLVGTLMAQPSLPLLHDMVDDSFAYVTPVVPTSVTGGAYVPLTITVKNDEPVAVDLQLSAVLPAGFSLASGAPPATVSAGTVAWAVSLPANGSQDLEWAVRVPNTSGSFTIPISITQSYGSTSIADGTATVAIEIQALDTTLPAVISQLQAMTLSGSDANARNAAVASLQAAQSSIAVANWEQAIDQLVTADGKLDSVRAASVKSYEAAIDNVMKEVEARWWVALPACPATPPCASP